MACAEVVDLSDEESPPNAQAEPREPTEPELSKAVQEYLEGKDLSSISLKALRKELEQRFGLAPGGLDHRKDDIRKAATELVQAAQQSAQVQETPVQAAGSQKKRPALTGDSSGPTKMAKIEDPATNSGAEVKKKRKIISAWSIWMSDNRSSVVESLVQSLSRTPTQTEIFKACGDKWKNIGDADRALYDEKARVAKAQEESENPPQASETDKKRGKGKGRGKGKRQGTTDAAVSAPTRSEFLRSFPVLRCVFDSGKPDIVLPKMDLAARIFKSDGAGWFGSSKFDICVGGKMVSVSASVVLNVSGSKYWEDGDGLEEARGAAATAGPAGMQVESVAADNEVAAAGPVECAAAVSEVAAAGSHEVAAELPVEVPAAETRPGAAAEPDPAGSQVCASESTGMPSQEVAPSLVEASEIQHLATPSVEAKELEEDRSTAAEVSSSIPATLSTDAVADPVSESTAEMSSEPAVLPDLPQAQEDPAGRASGQAPKAAEETSAEAHVEQLASCGA
eukprot:TRINITY_DN22106_c0_g1_i1.p1 TRINITY_DN22106_c0_g1~~TRINITY_DN22106_c0_g1_i1.p1  ORF type:complete len:527 (-),score=139.23 TRINITY_DN22106_c0_g1_i1:386-1912(-)